MQKIKNILKIFAFILIIKASFLVSFAFLWDDLGLDLYKKIDAWVNSLENTQYSYELKWWIEWWTITEKVNRILKNKWLGHCEVKNITEEDIEEISNWNIELLTNKLNGKCSSIEELNNIQENIVFLRLETINRAKEKTKQIQKISKIWLYSDWNIKNSPFDIIYDIKEIDQIVFTQEVEYKWERGVWDDELWDYLKWKLNDYENEADKKVNKELEDLNEIADEIINWESKKDLEEENIDKENKENLENSNSGYINIIW